jgi:glutamine amidotransferase-like uncharacterized protein
MTRNRTEWMIAQNVTVSGLAHPGQYEDNQGTHNDVAAIVIQRTSGIGTVVLEGRPESLVELAQKITDAAARITVTTYSDEKLMSLYGRTA